MFARYSNIITWIILTLCWLVWWRTVYLVSPYLCYIFLYHHFTIWPFHHPPFDHFTIATLHSFMNFSYDLIRNYSGKMPKLIQKYQGSDKSLLCQFSGVECIKGMEVFQVPSLAVSHFPPFNIFQDHPNKVERKGLEQKKKNLMNYIFGNFDLMMWWEAKARSGTTTWPFE